MRKLILIPFKSGELMRDSKTSEGWATMLVVEESITINNGILNHRKRVGAIRDKKENLTALALKAGDDLNAKLAEFGGKESRVVYIETTEPQYDKHQPKINPKTKEVIKTAAGQPVYLSAKVMDASNEDQLVSAAPAVVAKSGAEKIA